MVEAKLRINPVPDGVRWEDLKTTVHPSFYENAPGPQGAVLELIIKVLEELGYRFATMSFTPGDPMDFMRDSTLRQFVRNELYEDLYLEDLSVADFGEVNKISVFSKDIREPFEFDSAARRSDLWFAPVPVRTRPVSADFGIKFDEDGFPLGFPPSQKRRMMANADFITPSMWKVMWEGGLAQSSQENVKGFAQRLGQSPKAGSSANRSEDEANSFLNELLGQSDVHRRQANSAEEDMFFRLGVGQTNYDIPLVGQPGEDEIVRYLRDLALEQARKGDISLDEVQSIKVTVTNLPGLGTSIHFSDSDDEEGEPDKSQEDLYGPLGSDGFPIAWPEERKEMIRLLISGVTGKIETDPAFWRKHFEGAKQVASSGTMRLDEATGKEFVRELLTRALKGAGAQMGEKPRTSREERFREISELLKQFPFDENDNYSGETGFIDWLIDQGYHECPFCESPTCRNTLEIKERLAKREKEKAQNKVQGISESEFRSAFAEGTRDFLDSRDLADVREMLSDLSKFAAHISGGITRFRNDMSWLFGEIINPVILGAYYGIGIFAVLLTFVNLPAMFAAWLAFPGHLDLMIATGVFTGWGVYGIANYLTGLIWSQNLTVYEGRVNRVGNFRKYNNILKSFTIAGINMGDRINTRRNLWLDDFQAAQQIVNDLAFRQRMGRTKKTHEHAYSKPVWWTLSLVETWDNTRSQAYLFLAALRHEDFGERVLQPPVVGPKAMIAGAKFGHFMRNDVPKAANDMSSFVRAMFNPTRRAEVLGGQVNFTQLELEGARYGHWIHMNITRVLAYKAKENENLWAILSWPFAYALGFLRYHSYVGRLEYRETNDRVRAALIAGMQERAQREARQNQ